MQKGVRSPQQVRPYRQSDPLTYGLDRGQLLFEQLVNTRVNLGDRLLDIGCGYGGICIAYAKTGRTAFAVDVDPKNIEVVNRRILSREAQPGQIFPIRASTLALPLPEATVDLALMIGVAEWLGYTDSRKPVRTLQISGLREAFRVVKPGGHLIIGTKNRLFPRYFWRDGQLKMPLINVLPRRLANWLSLTFLDYQYRGHIYSYWGWKKLITEAGFILQGALVPIFTYQFPLMLVRPWSPTTIRRNLSTAVQQLPPPLRSAAVDIGSRTRMWYYPFVSSLGLLGLGAGTFLFICQKPI